MAEAKVGTVTLQNVRLSYAHIFKPGKDMKDDKGNVIPGKFGAVLMIDPDTDIGKKNLAKLKKAKEDVMSEQWGSKPPKLPADRLCTKKYKVPEDEDGEPNMDAAKEEYMGMYLVSARNKDRPQIVDNRKGADKKWIRLEEADGRPYSGCYANVIVRLWAQDNTYGQRVNAALELVQFYKHGEAFSEAAPIDAEEMLDDELVEGGDIDELDDYGSSDSSDDEDGDLV